MEAQKFKNIIQYNKEFKEETQSCLEKAYGMLDISDNPIMDVFQVLRPLFLEKRFLVIQVPMKDREVGAICYKGEFSGYILVNSALPKTTVNFALCHEFCHVCVNEDVSQDNIELYTLNDYLDHKEEKIANQFAGAILMPEPSVRRMYSKFKSEAGEEELRIVLCKLMNYFQAPYTAVLIRLCELGILGYSKEVEAVLEISDEEKESIFMNCWLDMNTLKATKRDDFPKLYEILTESGKENVDKGYMSDYSYKSILSYVQQLYKTQIKGGTEIDV